MVPIPSLHRNEVYQGWDFDKAAKHIRETGFDGIEKRSVHPGRGSRHYPADARAEYRRIIAEEGLVFAGLQWLMVSPRACTSPRPTRISAPSWTHIVHLVDLCADLGPNGIMVFGSPCSAAHRRFHREEATRRFTDGLASVPLMPAARCPHPRRACPRTRADVVLSLDEAASIVPPNRQPGHPDDVRFS